MILKEIEEVIDKSDFCLIKYKGDRTVFSLHSIDSKEILKLGIDHKIKKGFTYILFKFDDNSDDIERRWIVDHISEEKKTVKKKLYELTDEEIWQVKERICADHPACDHCPLLYNHSCLAHYFSDWKKNFENTKDIEVEMEVEE